VLRQQSPHFGIQSPHPGAALTLGVVERASELGIAIALDFALNCSPDHPWLRGLVEGLHHIDAKSIVSAEEHGVVDEVFAKSEHAPLGVFHRSSPPQSSGP
jgi:hypothetical protein